MLFKPLTQIASLLHLNIDTTFICNQLIESGHAHAPILKLDFSGPNLGNTHRPENICKTILRLHFHNFCSVVFENLPGVFHIYTGLTTQT